MSEIKEKIVNIACPCKGNHGKQKELEHELQNLKTVLQTIEKDMAAKHEIKLQYLKEQFDYILKNEQIRTSHMLREAYIDRQEKISALQTQLQCSNLAALMYVLCSERRKSEIKIAKLTEDYTKYIKALQTTLIESQSLILHLARGFKTAARVDSEWREKMKSLITEFHAFIYDFAGGRADVNQYFLDMPDLLSIKATVKDDPDMEPDYEDDEMGEKLEEEEEVKPEAEMQWWQRVGEDCHPFVVYGDMSELDPGQRVKVIKALKAKKTIPKKWKEYAFHDMYIGEKCENFNVIKDKFKIHKPPGTWEYVQSETQYVKHSGEISRRPTIGSVDFRSGMSSIIKLMASSGTAQGPKTCLLGAKDSFEIVSATRLREKGRRSHDYSDKVKLSVRNKVEALFREKTEENLPEEDSSVEREVSEKLVNVEENDDSTVFSALRDRHNDSRIIPPHLHNIDSVIDVERECPVEECQQKFLDSFMQSLPPYMRVRPSVHYQKSLDEYEACTPQQLKELERRIEERKKKERVDFGMVQKNPLAEWNSEEVVPSGDTKNVPCCDCKTPAPTPVISRERIFKLVDPVPMKQKVDEINKEFFFNDNIDFNRFRLVGQNDGNGARNPDEGSRLVEVTAILNDNPSLCGIFLGNVPC